VATFVLIFVLLANLRVQSIESFWAYWTKNQNYWKTKQYHKEKNMGEYIATLTIIHLVFGLSVVILFSWLPTEYRDPDYIKQIDLGLLALVVIIEEILFRIAPYILVL